MTYKKCFVTIKNTGKRLQMVKDMEFEGLIKSSSLALSIPDLPIFEFYHGNRCWAEDELKDIIYEDDPRYQADIELAIANDSKQNHYTQRSMNNDYS